MRTALVSVALLAASTSASAAEPKIAYVDMNRALNEVEDGKAAKAKLKLEFKAKQTKLDEMQNKLKDKKDEFEKRKGMMKDGARRAKQEEMQREFMELQQTYMQLQQELMANENQITQEIASKLHKIIGQIGDRDSYMMILDIGDTVLYHKRHMDLTDQVVREYNKHYAKK